MSLLQSYCDWAAWLMFALFLTFGAAWILATLVWFVRHALRWFA